MQLYTNAEIVDFFEKEQFAIKNIQHVSGTFLIINYIFFNRLTIELVQYYIKIYVKFYLKLCQFFNESITTSQTYLCEHIIFKYCVTLIFYFGFIN